jgi:hypothetical protein
MGSERVTAILIGPYSVKLIESAECNSLLFITSSSFVSRSKAAVSCKSFSTGDDRLWISPFSGYLRAICEMQIISDDRTWSTALKFLSI